MSAATPAPVMTVRAVGMTTPLGDGLDASCAALRAGLSRFREMPWIALESPEKKPIVPVGATVFEEGRRGLGRLVDLAASALADMLARAETTANDLATAGMYAAIGEQNRPGLDPRVASDLGPRLAERLGLRCAHGMTVVAEGHAGFVEALSRAARDLAQKKVPRAIVGGVDALTDDATVAWLHGARRIKAGDRPVGLFPGEGAAFALLTPGKTPGAITIAGAVTTTESATFDRDTPCIGTGLGDAIRRTRLALEDGAEIGLVVSDMNGEVYRSEEIGYAFTRALAKTQFRLWHAADAIGDTGAAAPAIGLGMAARALQRGYARTGAALVLASSDGGLRGSFAVQKNNEKG
ncbi:MAG: hypothetical protein U0441_24515 [Polyangiaceae bacterium]